MIDRRSFVSAIALSLLAVPLAAEAQQPAKVVRIGILNPGPLAPRLPAWEAFRQGLHELGYVGGQDIVLEFRPRPPGGGRPVSQGGMGTCSLTSPLDFTT